MKKFLKVVGVLFGMALLLLVGLALFVNFYFTDQRVKSLLLPRLEDTLGRQVTMGKLDVGLFRGITAKDFAVKEKNGTGDFFRAKEFVLRYDLLPLFHGQLVITEAALREPFIRIERDRQGRFNFQTLAFLKKPPEQEPVKGGKPGPVALPLALTIDQIAIEKARFVVEDQLGKIPAVDGTGDVSISVNTEDGALVYSGRYDFTADVAYKDLKPHLTGQGDINPRSVSYQVDTTLGGQTVHLEGMARNWQQTPQVRLDLSSKRLDVDRLLALLGGGRAGTPPSARPPASMPEKPAPSAKSSPAATARLAGRKEPAAKPSAPLGASLPPGLTATGTVNLAQVRYRNLEMQNLTASYELKDGILRVSDLSGRAAGGDIVGSSRIDLNRPEPAYAATIKMFSLQAGQIAALLSEQYGNWLSGHLTSSIVVAGSGTAWPQIKKALTAKAKYSVRDGQLRESPITTAVAGLLNLPELRSPAFRNLTGTLRVEKGQVLLDSAITGPDLQAKVNGTVGLDGQLNLPVALHLTGPLASKIQATTSLAKYLTAAGGGVAIDFKLVGQASRPRPVLNLGAAGERLKKKVEKKAVQELQRFLQKKLPSQPQQQSQPQQPSPQDFLKGLLGR